MSCSRTQHGGGRFRTPDLSLRSPTLYHWATALPSNKKVLIRSQRYAGWSTPLLFANGINRFFHNMSHSLCLAPASDLPHEKTNKMTMHPDSDQPGHPPSLISLRCALNGDPSFLHADSKDLIRLGRCPGWSESLQGTHTILLVLSWGSSYVLGLKSHYCIKSCVAHY